MREITEKEFEQNFEHYMDLIEKEKTEILIRLSSGKVIAAVPFPDELVGVVPLDKISGIQYNDIELANDDDHSAESSS